MSELNKTIKKSYIELNKDEVNSLIKELDESQFRAQQIQNWVFDHHVETWDEMENLPIHIREELSARLRLHPLEINYITDSKNASTQKILFQTQNGYPIESVLMYDQKRTTVCISSQVGCAVDCKFCATASMGFIHNLSTGEMVDQVIHLQRQSKTKITNVVFMGMGEPFLNYRRVIEAAEILNKKMGFGARRITISTAGIVPKIRQMAEENHKYKLAISLNATNELSRERIMPLTNTYTLITFEYVLLKGVNDSPSDGERLLVLLQSLPCKVNVIPYNEIGGSYSRPSENTINAFLDSLKHAPFTVTVRWSKGTEIDAGCGQLAVHGDI